MQQRTFADALMIIKRFNRVTVSTRRNSKRSWYVIDIYLECASTGRIMVHG